MVCDNGSRSLSTLGEVLATIKQASNKPQLTKHIPSRNSKLTFLLQSVLKPSCKIVGIINLMASRENEDETINSLNFVEKCKTPVV